MPLALHGLLRSALALLAALVLSVAPAGASYLDDPQSFDLAVTALRSKVGEHARVFKIEIEPEGIAIEAQDPSNRTHIDRWRYGIVRILRVPFNRLAGPEAVDPTLINPDLEANLFDLADVDLSATIKLVQAAVARARLNDPAVVTRIEIQRQVFILPKPSSGNVRWTLHVDSGRERASVFANAKGQITGADLSGTQRARTLNILKEPALAGTAAADFRAFVGAGAVLSEVSIQPKTIGFSTSIPDRNMGRLGFNMPSSEIYTWDLNGLQQRLGSFNISAERKAQEASPFATDDVDWTVIGTLINAALAKAALPRAEVSALRIGRSITQPGAPVLIWTVEIVEPSGETTRVIANLKGDIQRVILPASRQVKPKWLEPGTMAGAISRALATFGKDAKLASLVFNDRGGRITVDEANGKPATFDFSADDMTRSSISFSLESSGPRMAAGEVAFLDEGKIAALQREAMNRLAAGKQAYMESVSIGAHPFAARAGARAIEVRLRDRAEDSAQAQYAWIVFDFQGRPLNSSKF